MIQHPSPLILSTHLNHLEEAAQALITYAASCKVWLFKGELGAGKTTLIKAICKQLGVREHVTSPTFSLINTYYLPFGQPVYHLDAYRLNQEAEIIDMDYPFYLDTGAYCFIEWPQKIVQFISTSYLDIKVDEINLESRRLSAKLVSD
jgi:tRNA threonylcarbamoyladenosine biosynthesis protein TsaE